MIAMSEEDAPAATRLLREMRNALRYAPGAVPRWELTGVGELPSVFAVSDLACAAIGAAGLAVADFAARDGEAATAVVDRRLAAFWFASSLRPLGWQAPPLWEAIAGDYACADGWIRLHTNAPHHRSAALAVLGVGAERASVAHAVTHWGGDELEAAIVERGGCAARMRTSEQWRGHPQGRAVAAEPLLQFAPGTMGDPVDWPGECARPLRGVRVLDLTRVIAGPVATRFLAGYGADVLRIDPPDWDEPAVVPEMTLGKRCARLNLKSAAGRACFEHLLSQADVLVHGYRGDVLDGLGFDIERRARLRPGLVDVSLDAYGFGGPWRNRRGFDSLVQMSVGIAETGMHTLGRDRPTPLPVQALDHAVGYLLAAAAVRGLSRRRDEGMGSAWRTSLARMAQLLQTEPVRVTGALAAAETEADLGAGVEASAWGDARRLRPPLVLDGVAMYWDRAATRLGSSPARW